MKLKVFGQLAIHRLKHIYDQYRVRNAKPVAMALNAAICE
jgi:hypothetical protein